MSKKYAIAEDLSRQITSGALQPGQALPSLSELCDQYGVAPGTVRAAIDLLEEDVLIVPVVTTVQGAGMYVGEPGTVPGTRQLAFECLVGRIALCALRPGDKLPSHTELAAEFGISVGTAKQVVRRLRTSGLVRSEDGKGTFIMGELAS